MVLEQRREDFVVPFKRSHWVTVFLAFPNIFILNRVATQHLDLGLGKLLVINQNVDSFR